MSRRVSYLKIALRGVRFYWRTEVSVFLGAAVATSVLVGGLLVGDCVYHSLRRFALLRLGETQAAMQAHGRFFDAGLASRLERESGATTVAALVLNGIVRTDAGDGNAVQVNRVQVVGVTPDFWRLSAGEGYVPAGDHVALNAKLAERLGVEAGATVSVRVGKPSLMPRDAPLSSRSEKLTQRGTFWVEYVVPDEHLGRFSLAANQVSPHNLFVDIAWLQDAAGLPGRANVLLVGDVAEGVIPVDELSASLKSAWRVEDVGIGLRRVGSVVQVESDRVFLDPAAAEAARFAGLEVGSDTVGTLTYLVNDIRKGDRSTPYSFAVAMEATTDDRLGLVPPEMDDDQIIINQWLADEIGAAAGDRIDVGYYALTGKGFEERSREFTVLRVACMDEFADERARMTEFPGLTDVDQCREWDVGMPMEEAALQEEANQAYWEAYGSTPKLVVTLKAGREMWANRFGDTTAVRYRIGPGQDDALRSALASAVDPAALGLFMLPVREQALKAVDEAMSFGELFLSLSCFLIGAALMLTGMLFVFGIQQRAEEMGVLLGVGHRPARVRLLFLCEGTVVELVGAALGGVLGVGYTRLLLWGLGRYWQGAVANAAIQYDADAKTVAEGIAISLFCAVFAMGVAMWRQAKRPARELLVGDLGQDRPVKAGAGSRWRTRAVCAVSALVAVGAVAFGATAGPEHSVYVFFGAGFLLLVAGLSGARLLLQRYERCVSHRLSIAGLGMRNAARRGGRSLTAVALLACGCFMVFAVSAMQQDLAAFADARWSGTGGFALFGESTLAVPDALETPEGAESFGLDRVEELEHAEIVSLRVRDGDDASCFNLNRAQAPRLLGLDPDAFASRGAFVSKGSEGGEPWSLLDLALPDGVVPGLAGDANTAMWNLHKKVGPEKGGEIAYVDERGEMFRVKLVGAVPMPLSVFQGTVLISKENFTARYPSEEGYRMFLVDVAADGDVGAVQRRLASRLERVGLDLTTALERLLEFHGVEATYLSMFLVLGGLGVVLGTLGLGIVVMRNMLERRSELAILRCVGFSRGRVLWMVLAEHWMLLGLGVLCGTVSAGLAIYPSVSAPGMHVPILPIGLLLAGILLAGVASTVLAVRVSLRGSLIPALRKE